MWKLKRDYGMLAVLIGLCVLFSALTLNDQMPEGDDAARQVVKNLTAQFDRDAVILAVGAGNKPSGAFAERVDALLKEKGFERSRLVVGIPRDLRHALEELQEQTGTLSAIAASGDVPQWRLIEILPEEFPGFSSCVLEIPKPYKWPDFLKRSNLLAIVDRIVVIAVIAIGMTMVIITAGIDLSVGSLIALSAVISTSLMKRWGGTDASGWIVLFGFLAGILSCGAVGAAGGFIVARFKVPPFITTLAIMMMGRGLAFMITDGASIYEVPKSLTWLGQGRTLGMPNTIILLILLYAAAHVFMSYTRLGRHIYAVGGNEEASRLSGISVSGVIVFVYIVSSSAAGLGGCIQASQLDSGTPNMGIMFELYVIAAVVVGGTSLSGGSGRILGTLIGAFIISVIQNGMNLLGIESYTQQVLLGAVIVGGVLLDKARSGKKRKTRKADKEVQVQ